MSRKKQDSNIRSEFSSPSLSDQEFLDLVEKYRHEFFRYVNRAAWNTSDVEDVFSEAVLAAWRQREKFEVGTNFRAWMYKILTNKIYVANRHTQRNSVDLEEINPERMAIGCDDSSRMAEDREWFLQQVDDNLFDAVDVLREPERQCLMLRAIENCTYKEIADILAIPVGTVMTHLARGRAKARQVLEQAVPA